jgi:hypothetical protein
MDENVFWEIIGRYNNQTILIQIILFVFIIISFLLSYLGKIKWIVKLQLGITILFIGIVFFGYYRTENIQKYFALPLFIICGFLFIYESVKNKNDKLNKFNRIQLILLSMYILYPFISYILGNKFPMIVTYIMPCPIISIAITIYSGYRNKNILLLICMALWGITGIKAFFANAYEDLILLICGVYCIYLIIKHKKIIKMEKG